MAKIAIAVLSGRDHNPWFTKSLVELVVYLGHQKKHSFMTMFRGNVSNIAAGRQSVLDDALTTDFTHLLFLDDDMAFPMDILDSMLESGFPVTALNAAKKLPNHLSFSAVDLAGYECSSLGKSGCERVLRAGTGIMLIELNALSEIPKPHFEQKYDILTGKFHGEDYYFCDKLNYYGVPIGVDHSASQGIGHIGDYNYGITNGTR